MLPQDTTNTTGDILRINKSTPAIKPNPPKPKDTSENQHTLTHTIRAPPPFLPTTIKNLESDGP